MRRALLQDNFSFGSFRLKQTMSGTCLPSTSTMRITWPFFSSRPRYSLGGMTCSREIAPFGALATVVAMTDVLNLMDAFQGALRIAPEQITEWRFCPHN